MVRYLKIDEPTAGELEAAGIEPPEPLVFPLRGQEFQVVDALPGYVALKLGVAQDPDTEEPKRLKAIDDFFRTVVIPEHRPRFLQLLVEADPVIDIDELVRLMNALAEEMGKDRTEESQTSATSPSTTTPTLTAGGSEPQGDDSPI